jgi:peptidoglycan-N-acetylglucosamine deacetylase
MNISNKSLLTIFILLGGVLSSAVNAQWQDNLIRSVDTKQKVVALTYDDGPDPRYTPQILKLLKQYNAKATFFLIGNQAVKYADIVKQEVDEGHAIANHTLTHPRNLEDCSPMQILDEIEGCEKILQQQTESHPHFFRPPRGFIDQDVYKLVTNKKYKVVLWTVCGDHHDAQTPEAMADRILDVAQPGSIILLHDGTFYSRWKDVEATRLVLDNLSKKGYKFITIQELLDINETKEESK